MTSDNPNQPSRSGRSTGHRVTPVHKPHSYPPRNTTTNDTNHTRDRSFVAASSITTTTASQRTFQDYYAPTRESETPSETAHRVSRNFLFLPENQRPRTDEEAAALLRRCGPTSMTTGPLSFGDFWQSVVAHPGSGGGEEYAPTGAQMISLWIGSCLGLLERAE
ncbi:uncharacterized protein STEHIDRAFT_162714 [Stereum hirsutum FP-91666 SS1]|uniref:Uncharacterized protein n=1 Tax=Stereum hirsutum (strain FP-91666) TaxID=721885 RepID=R7RY85_STEHR|nr:uncharacterized protein STEHIDRAFT_162714 [Stereum hirsutum FP-91666 SS1]EIM80294.1 hypothetical protein STEHIDRAFT_162714 [Stereum hirsutum FP-91666 SS1]